MPQITTAFLPVSDPSTAAEWYRVALGLRIRESGEASAVLEGDGGAALTLLGPASGISQAPGLDWATCNLLVPDVEALRERFAADGVEMSEVMGDPDRCRFFTIRDPDRNLLLVTDR